MKIRAVMTALVLAPLAVACSSNELVRAPGSTPTLLVQQLSSPEVLNAVNLCVDSPTGRAAYVTDTVMTPENNIRVTTVSVDGVRRSCTVDVATRQVIAMDTMGRDTNQIFVPVKLSPNEPKGACFATQRITSNGMVQGYLLQRDPTSKCAGQDWLQGFEMRK